MNEKGSYDQLDRRYICPCGDDTGFLWVEKSAGIGNRERWAPAGERTLMLGCRMCGRIMNAQSLKIIDRVNREFLRNRNERNVAYHISPVQNRESIEANGLMAPADAVDDNEAIWFYRDEDYALAMAEQWDGPVDVWEVDTTGRILHPEISPHLNNENEQIVFDIYPYSKDRVTRIA